MKIWVINGPNLNLLGKREPTVYGHRSFEQYFDELKTEFSSLQLLYSQSNHEGDLIDYLHQANDSADGVILNAGAYTHTSVAIADAIKAIATPVLEVHISNTFAREAFRHHSYLSPNCEGVLVGFGLESYRLAIQYFKNKFDETKYT